MVCFGGIFSWLQLLGVHSGICPHQNCESGLSPLQLEFTTFLEILVPALGGEHIFEDSPARQTINSNIVTSFMFSELRARTKFSRLSLS